MKLSAAQVFCREDEDEALTTGRRRRHHRLRGRHNRRHRRRPLRHRSPCRRHHQPTCSCSGSDGTLTVGSAEVAWASKACTCLAKGSHIRGEAEDKGSLNKWVNINVENGLLEAQNVHFFPLRGLREGGLFIAKGAARENKRRFF